MTMSQQTAEVGTMAAKAAPIPPLIVGGSTYLGFDWDLAVKVATVAYLAILMGYTAWKWRRDWKAGKKDG